MIFSPLSTSNLDSLIVLCQLLDEMKHPGCFCGCLRIISPHNLRHPEWMFRGSGEEERGGRCSQSHLISYSLRLARPCDMRGDRNPPKRAAMKAVRMRGKVKTASPCLSSEKTRMGRLTTGRKGRAAQQAGVTWGESRGAWRLVVGVVWVVGRHQVWPSLRLVIVVVGRAQRLVLGLRGEVSLVASLVRHCHPRHT